MDMSISTYQPRKKRAQTKPRVQQQKLDSLDFILGVNPTLSQGILIGGLAAGFRGDRTTGSILGLHRIRIHSEMAKARRQNPASKAASALAP